MSWLSKTIRGFTNFEKAGEAYRIGKDYLGYGQDITRSAVTSLDALDANYQQRLAEGLPADVRQTYAAEQGRITDETARSNRAFGANLVQRAKATGGQISEQAATDASIENNAATADAAFNARNQIAASEADASLQNTYKLLDAIERVRMGKAGVGIDEQNIGAGIYNNALNIMMQRQKELYATLRQIIQTSGQVASTGAIASSRDFKKDVVKLDENEAIRTVAGLTPMVFTYKGSNESHVGFIAEDVPDLVAMPGRKSLHPMDFVGVLTKVVQAQQKTIEQLVARVGAIEATGIHEGAGVG